MLSWFRRGGRAPVIPGLAPDAASADALQAVAKGFFSQREALQVHDSVEALIADPNFAQAPQVLIGGVASEALARIPAARGGSACELTVLAEDPIEHIRLRDLDAGLAGRGVRIRPLSRCAAVARALFAGQASPDRVLRLAADGGVPIFIIGEAGALAAHLVLALLRLMQLPGITASITLAGPGMAGLLADLRAALPELDASGGLAATEVFPPIQATTRPALILATDGAPGDADLRALDPSLIAKIIRPVLPSWEAIGRSKSDDGTDRIARAIHNLHLEERRSAGGRSGDQPSQAPWEELPERFREASRHQASHIPLKLRWAGGRTVGQAAEGAAPFSWTAAELTALAEAEHGRWAAVSRLEGWSAGPVRDDATKKSPLLVPFDQLTPAMRDLDTLPVRSALRHAMPVLRDVVIAVHGAAATPQGGFERTCRQSLERLRAKYGGRTPVVRISQDTALTGALAAAAQAAGVPVQAALAEEPGAAAGSWLAGAERVAIGAAAAALLPAIAETMVIGADGSLSLGTQAGQAR